MKLTPQVSWIKLDAGLIKIDTTLLGPADAQIYEFEVTLVDKYGSSHSYKQVVVVKEKIVVVQQIEAVIEFVPFTINEISLNGTTPAYTMNSI